LGASNFIIFLGGSKYSLLAICMTNSSLLRVQIKMLFKASSSIYFHPYTLFALYNEVLKLILVPTIDTMPILSFAIVKSKLFN